MEVDGTEEIKEMKSNLLGSRVTDLVASKTWSRTVTQKQASWRFVGPKKEMQINRKGKQATFFILLGVPRH